MPLQWVETPVREGWPATWEAYNASDGRWYTVEALPAGGFSLAWAWTRGGTMTGTGARHATREAAQAAAE